MEMWLVVSLARLVVVAIAAALGVYLSAWLLQAITPELDLWAELLRGNMAMAVVLAGVILAVAAVMHPVVSVALESYDLGPGAAATALLIEGARLVFGAIVGGLSVVLAAGLYNLLTGSLDERAELRGGNVAVGVVEAAVMLGVALLVSAPATALVRAVLDAVLGR